MSPSVLTGLDRLVAGGFVPLQGQRVGLLAHPASVDARLRHAVPLLHSAPGVELQRLFGPQHGLRGETQDNMIEWYGFRERATGLTVRSLYGKARKPTAEMLEGLDTLVVDLQDVGARYYTFVWSLLLCLEACADQGLRVVVLDRPNPIGGVLREGNVLDMDFRSFVGMAPIPMRHGLTVGELARLFRAHFELDVELEVIWMEGWRRAMGFAETGLPWVLPSPNMPTCDTALVYPGFCLLEGTVLSEGRGTTRPFEIFGAPWIEPHALVRELEDWKLPGCILRSLHYEPTFHKHAGHLCGGAQVHVTDRETFRPVLTAAAVLVAVRELWPDEFDWRPPPYEYEVQKLPIDVLAGGPAFREAIEGGVSPYDLAATWEPELAAFSRRAAEFLHYE
jgi:uncharacterized protein YbbC (DUF1343 family)